VRGSHRAATRQVLLQASAPERRRAQSDSRFSHCYLPTIQASQAPVEIPRGALSSLDHFRRGQPTHRCGASVRAAAPVQPPVTKPHRQLNREISGASCPPLGSGGSILLARRSALIGAEIGFATATRDAGPMSQLGQTRPWGDVRSMSEFAAASRPQHVIISSLKSANTRAPFIRSPRRRGRAALGAQ
jgi:hypothetical protein